MDAYGKMGALARARPTVPMARPSNNMGKFSTQAGWTYDPASRNQNELSRISLSLSLASSLALRVTHTLFGSRMQQVLPLRASLLAELANSRAPRPRALSLSFSLIWRIKIKNSPLSLSLRRSRGRGRSWSKQPVVHANDAQAAGRTEQG